MALGRDVRPASGAAEGSEEQVASGVFGKWATELGDGLGMEKE